MTSTIDTAAQVTDDPPPPRRRRTPAAVASVVVLLIAAGTSVVVYAHTYSPLAPGGFSGPTAGPIRAVTDGFADPTRQILVGSTGSAATMTYSIVNNGSHPVKILGSAVDPDPKNPEQLAMSWSSPYDARGDLLGGRIPAARPLPATIPAHKLIALHVTFTKPECPAGVTAQITDIPIRTESLWVHHVWHLTLGSTDYDDLVPVAVCSPKAALQHLTKN